MIEKKDNEDYTRFPFFYLKNYGLLFLCFIQFVSCQDKKYTNMNEKERVKVQEEINNRPNEIWPTNKDKNGDYYYKTSICSFPGYISENAGSHFVTDKESIGFLKMENGVWPQTTGSVLNDEYHPLPKKLYVAWFSASENKFYEGLFELPSERIKEEFNKMWLAFASNEQIYKASKYKRYTDIIVGVAPRGDVVVWLSGGLQSVEIGQYTAKETKEISWKDFAGMNGMGEGATRENYLIHITKSKYPISFGKLGQYEQKYTWKPKIQSHDPVEVILHEMEMYNGEKERIYYEYKGDNPYEKRAVPKKIEFNWMIKEISSNSAEITFNEEDIYNGFHSLSDSPNSCIDIVVQLDKKNAFDKVVLKNKNHNYVLQPDNIKIRKGDYDNKKQLIKNN